METWYGAAGICVNEHIELLMILEGQIEESRKWSIPTGGLEQGETFEECVLREIKEETGYAASTLSKLKVKKGVYSHLNLSYPEDRSDLLSYLSEPVTLVDSSTLRLI